VTTRQQKTRSPAADFPDARFPVILNYAVPINVSDRLANKYHAAVLVSH
jgi:hypothetical protein